ncbi:uroporphyrinogen-III synthase [Cellulomonas sp. zg-ZUI199]|uniref:Uroporphyrinogen-III synthase n=1 Tax=Cellulomonas wangleii TaxID=2816956 RepID=A0ABX8D426_9CELL|nr:MULTISPECIES: uroporphyrinogen-III synthase [Cellulomonas]MBO0898798.1 uroporphyrinogen-III synthase [Cellulomonas sp. zg-ZUI22]MBO0923914.1 uroporphyrinogen-III synthase [Cellulomonas wangleii]MBO0924196.1 uroporphyrinogen-III synthase [Cellulomonas wangleii]QVI62214.1 uroporphyrinogen-III synthase [Cellulomonas wangleii]
MTADGPTPARPAADAPRGAAAAGALDGWRVLVPRPPLDPAPAAGASAAGHPDTPDALAPAVSPAAIALRAAGAEPVVVPLVRTQPVDDQGPLDDALLALGAGWYPWLAVTSQAAVAVLADRAAAHDDGLAALVARGGARVAAVGPGTARALRALGVRVDVVPPVRSTAADLVVALLAAAAGAPPLRPGDAPTGPRVLFPRGDLAAGTLADGLRAAGWAVDDLVVYRTTPAGPPDAAVARAWADGDVHAALLTSASSVRALLDHLGTPPPATRVVVIGPSTADEARRRGLRVDAVADQQTLAGLVDALTRHVVGTGATPGAVPPSAPVTPTEDTP